jgi:exopolysaccharide biosynthesis polyprenyl glycosylphosphotransferase
MQVTRYVVSDFLSAALAWILFVIWHKYTFNISIINLPSIIFSDNELMVGTFVIPLFWILLYMLNGYYRKIYHKSRLKELNDTFIICLIGFLILSFIRFLKNRIPGLDGFFLGGFGFICLHFSLTYIGRLIITSRTAWLIHNKVIGFNTLLIGGGGNSLKLYNEIESQAISQGNRFIGFISINELCNEKLSKSLPYLGALNQINSIINEYAVEEVIIAVENEEFQLVEQILTELKHSKVVIKITPSLHDYLKGVIKTTGIYYTPLIQISFEMMPFWQQTIKRLMDVFISLFAIIILIPAFIFAAIGVKISSRGPVLYKQKRIGKYGSPFIMIKFRTMYMDAEATGPQLSSKNDKRITPFGMFLRKVRLDEIPQFWTVLIGKMSLVGPRPERQYYIDQIIERAPHYMMLHKVKPGITSWGQVKYGYAENVEEMIERLKYDMLYIENMSIAIDIKIMIYTILIVLQGRGR